MEDLEYSDDAEYKEDELETGFDPDLIDSMIESMWTIVAACNSVSEAFQRMERKLESISLVCQELQVSMRANNMKLDSLTHTASID